MAWTIPDLGEGDFNGQSWCFQEDLEILVAGIGGQDCVLDGCAITGGADMTPAVAKGAVLSNGTLFPVTAGDVTITTADSTNPRIDLIVVNSSGAKAVRTGTAAASPKPAARSANDVVLGMVYVPAGDTAIATTQIVDKRMVRRLGPILIGQVSTAVTFSGTAAVQTVATTTLPSGLFAAGRRVRVSCYGYHQTTSTSQDITLTITYGGTTLYAGTMPSLGVDAERVPWSLVFVLTAVSLTSQVLNGQWRRSGEDLNPTTGDGGPGLESSASAVSVSATLRGTATVDSDAADRTLNVQLNHSSNNANASTTLDSATFELL